MTKLRKDGLATSVVMGTAALTLALTAIPAAAHEGREVGEYALVVGFGTEPAFAGFENSVQLIVNHHDTEEPVEGVADTLTVEVIFGDQSVEMALEPAFGSPGQYRAHFIPSRPGTYTFHFVGTIGDQAIDEEFTSGPDTFNDVEDASAVQFPVQDPSVGEIADRLDQEIPRLTERLDAIEAASSDGGSSSTLPVIAIVVGVLGLLLGGYAVFARRQAA